MPTAIDKLEKNSGQGQIRAAISECIAYAIKNEGLSREQASGKCFGIARNKTGKELK